MPNYELKDTQLEAKRLADVEPRTKPVPAKHPLPLMPGITAF